MRASSVDTLARRAVVEAEERLRSLELADPRLVPPLELRLALAPVRSDSVPHASRARTASGSVAPVSLPTSAPTVAEAIVALEEGRTTTRQLVEDSIEAARAHAKLGAVVALDEDAVRAEAEVLDAERRAGRARGALHGIPLTVKDIIDVAGLPTRAGSLAYDDLPKVDAASVARLRDAGALVIAKVATHEFALGVATPQCRNPHDPTRISGGSSGGSAIATAVGIGLASLGTDTRASLRVPAALCGVVGFKPTFGRVPAEGIVPLSWTIDHLGPIARNVADAGLLLEVLTGAALPTRGAEGRPLVIGVVPEVLADAQAEVTSTCAEVLGLLEGAGCQVLEIERPGIADLELSNHLGLIVSRSEAAAFHRSQGTDLERCIPEVRDQLQAALEIPAVDYLDAQRQRHVLSGRAMAAFAHCDVLAWPTTPVVAPPRGDYERYLLRLSRNTILWSLAGCPAVSLPCRSGDKGLPVGLQLAARPGAEATLVEAGLLVEHVLTTR
ncbi:MAG: amidase [Acidimicrobiaceae bacterium]|nr:amidase [Acidimicrobiaceae bacterium]